MFLAQLWLNKLLFFVVTYFYLKEFVSLSQKFDSHTANSKVHSYTDGGEFSGYSQCPKGINEGKVLRTNPNDVGDITCHFFFFSSSDADGFERIKHNLTSENFIPILAP